MVNNLRVVIAAAGSATRMGGKVNKQYMLLKGKPVLTYALDKFEEYDMVDQIVVVANAAEVDYCEREIVKKYGYRKVLGVIAGGRQRQDSVWAGLQYLGKDTDLVAVHDGARPLMSYKMLNELIDEAREWGAAVPGVNPKDTLKSVDRDGFVRQTLDRSSVVAIQTPQVFKYSELYSAYRLAQEDDFRATDDAAIFETYIGRVKVVAGEDSNLKITTPADLKIAEALLRDN
jgi:2-C-methyl-D-erythritol 4-phosphate cytidylyltransferase